MLDLGRGWVGIEGCAGLLERGDEGFAGLLEGTELFEAGHFCVLGEWLSGGCMVVRVEMGWLL